jgi:hypothetical protein
MNILISNDQMPPVERLTNARVSSPHKKDLIYATDTALAALRRIVCNSME